MPFPPVLNAAELVNQGWALFSDIADSGFGQSLSTAQRLSNFDIAPVNFDASYNPVTGFMQGFTDPVKPTAPDFTFTVSIPEPLSINTITVPEFGEPPDDDLVAPTLDFSGKPDNLDVPEPPDPPTFLDPEVPDEPTLLFPEAPTLENLNLPEPPDFIEVEFEGERPVHDIAEPDTFIDFTEEEYSSALLDEVTATLKSMLDNGTGMPAHVEQALVDRGRERVTAEEQQAVDRALSEWSARGFSIPPGALSKRVAETRQNAQNQANDFSRQVFLQRRQEEIENFRFAIAQGIALEGQLIQAHLNVQERAFNFALQTTNLAYRLFEARIALFNSELAQFQADAQVFEQRIRAEVNKLQQYEARLRAEAIRGEINETKVRSYVAQIQAVEQTVSVYRSRIEAVRALADVNNSKAQAFNSQILGYRSQIEAKTEEYNAWRTKIQGELGRVQAFQAETQAFSARLQAYESGVRAKAIVPEVEARIENTRIQQALAQLEAARTNISAEEAKIRAKADGFRSEAAMYGADAQIASAKAETNTRQFLAHVEENRTRAEQALAKARLDVEQVLRSGTIITGALDAAGRIASNTGAGAASAVNLGASIRASDSWNRNIASTE